MKTKPFEEHLYEKYDNPAKTALISYLRQMGHNIVDESENYYADVVSELGDQEYYSEAEIKASWKGKWPEGWKELRIPGRKRRLLNKYDSVTFYVFREDCRQCYVVKSEQMTNKRLKYAYGPKIRNGEKFFHIPVDEIELIGYRDRRWEILKW